MGRQLYKRVCLILCSYIVIDILFEHLFLNSISRRRKCEKEEFYINILLFLYIAFFSNNRLNSWLDLQHRRNKSI